MNHPDYSESCFEHKWLEIYRFIMYASSIPHSETPLDAGWVVVEACSICGAQQQRNVAGPTNHAAHRLS
jgi:hypothetical protein